MKLTSTIAFIAALIIVCGPVNAQSRKATDQFEVTEFSIIESSVVANIQIRQSPTANVIAEGDEELLNLLDVRMDNDKLILDMDERNIKKNKKRSHKLLISISTPTLTKLDNQGVGNIKIEGTFTTPTLSVTSEGVGNLKADNLEAGTLYIASEGVGNITLQGKSDKVDIHSEGVGNVNASKLIARNATVTSEGVGNVSCHASEYLKACSDGIGNITYYGNPAKKDISKNGLGRIKAGR